MDGLQFVTARGWEDLSNLIKTYEELHLPVTEEIIYEFIRNHDAAQDMSAYYDLYRKYEDDYRIEEILKGQAPAEVYARLMNAEFDEKLSVVNLLLDGLMKMFERVDMTKQGDAENDQLVQKAGQMLEHAFDFCDEAFGMGQEMLIFITGLTMTSESAMLLSVYPCERYQQYQKELLTGTKRGEILAQL